MFIFFVFIFISLNHFLWSEARETEKLATCWEVITRSMKSRRAICVSEFSHLLENIGGINFLSSLFADFEHFSEVLFLVFSQSGSFSTGGFWTPSSLTRWIGIRGALPVPVSSRGLSTVATPCSNFDACIEDHCLIAVCGHGFCEYNMARYISRRAQSIETNNRYNRCQSI